MYSERVTGVAIKLRGLTLKHAFPPIDADIPPGGYAQIVGPIGSGRTSLLLTIAGRMKHHHGTGVVNGYPLDDSRVRRLMGVARVSGAVQSDDHLHIRQLVKNSRLDTGVLREAWQLLDIAPDEGERLEEMAEADRILVELGLCMASGARGIVLDDADAGLTVAEATQVRAGLRAIADSGRTVVVSCCDPDPRADVTIELPDVPRLPAAPPPPPAPDPAAAPAPDPAAASAPDPAAEEDEA